MQTQMGAMGRAMREARKSGEHRYVVFHDATNHLTGSRRSGWMVYTADQVRMYGPRVEGVASPYSGEFEWL